MHKTFKQWMQEVDLYIRKVIGLDHECIADWGYYDAYESGETALEAAIQALEFDGTVPEEYIHEILFPRSTDNHTPPSTEPGRYIPGKENIMASQSALQYKVVLHDIVYDWNNPDDEMECMPRNDTPVEWMSVVIVEEASDAAYAAATTLTDYTGWPVLAAQYTVTEYMTSGRRGQTTWGSFVTITPETRAANA